MKIYNFLLLTLSILIISCSEKSTDEQTEQKEKLVSSNDYIQITDEQFNKGDFKIGKIKKKQVSDKIRISGQVNVPPKFMHSVNSQFEGYVEKIDLIEGDPVEKGQTLFTLKNQTFLQFQENYITNYNKLEYLQANYERKAELIKDSIVSPQQFQKVRSDYQDMRSKVAAGAERLKMMNLNPKAVLNGSISSLIRIKAKISGTVENINIQSGSYLGMNKEAMRIINTEHIHLQLNAMEKDIDQIAKNDTLSFQVPEVSKKEFKAEVIQISNVVNADRKVLVHAHPITEIDFLKVGMFVEAFSNTGKKKTPSLPVTAFVERNGKTFLLQLVKHKNKTYYLKKINVETQKKDEGYQPLMNEVDQGVKYLVEGGFDLVK